MLDDKRFHDLSGNDYSYSEFLEQIKSYDKKDYEFYIGTDSQTHGTKVTVVTCICPYKFGSGGKVFYFRERISKTDCPTLRSRMLLEAYRSIEAAIEVEQHVKNKLTIHLDIGTTKRSKTSAFQNELQFLVAAQGFECAVKPHGFAASACSDRLTKN